MAPQPFPRRRFQFRLRTVMLLAAIVAVQCAVCLPMLKEWQAQDDAPAKQWIAVGGTGIIAPFQTNFVCTFDKIIRRRDGRTIRVPPRIVHRSATKS
jgi:hypothetical protein